MEPRDVEYVSGRFKDFYRQNSVNPPPEHEKREWGVQLWDENLFRRHMSVRQMGGDVNRYFSQESVRHAYVSASRYEHPEDTSMEDKEWIGSDLVFDLDADEEHMDTISKEDSWPDKLEECKRMVRNLVQILSDEFAFTDISIVFSGNRGFHVHVRDDSVQSLNSSQRGEIVRYVSGQYDLQGIFTGGGLEDWTTTFIGGWPDKVHKRLTEVFHTMSEEVSDLECSSTDNVREYRKEILSGETWKPEDFVSEVAEEVTHEKRAAVDEPVTTDVNRLIRVPSSLHGGTGLQTTVVEDLDSFVPLRDAVADFYKGTSIEVNVREDCTVYIGGREKSFSEGIHRVEEFLGIYLILCDLATLA